MDLFGLFLIGALQFYTLYLGTSDNNGGHRARGKRSVLSFMENNLKSKFKIIFNLNFELILFNFCRFQN